MPLACVLISDITGSTGLYEKKSNQFALEQVSKVLSRMRVLIESAGGECVKSQGDDVLSFFQHSEDAFQVAWAMIQENWPEGLSVHVGIYFGEILNYENDIYGSAVNTAARLCSLAKSGEIMLGDQSYDDLSPDSKAKMKSIGEMQLRGKAEPTRVYSCSAIFLAEQTMFSPLGLQLQPKIAEFADIQFGDQSWQISEGDSLTVGRAEDCDIIINQAWVSRYHAVISFGSAQLEIKDFSSYGSIIKMADGSEVLLHRRATLVSGNGIISFCTKTHVKESDAVSFGSK